MLFLSYNNSVITERKLVLYTNLNLLILDFENKIIQPHFCGPSCNALLIGMMPRDIALLIGVSLN